MWAQQKLNDLNTLDLFNILRLRTDTFVVAQQRIYPELDDHDLSAIHLFHKNDETQVIDAYARIFKTEGTLTFGRVVTAESVRGQGLGNVLADHILAVCAQYWPHEPITIEAQAQVTGFYEKHGFKVTSDPFIFNSTPHVQMQYQP